MLQVGWGVGGLVGRVCGWVEGMQSHTCRSSWTNE